MVYNLLHLHLTLIPSFNEFDFSCLKLLPFPLESIPLYSQKYHWDQPRSQGLSSYRLGALGGKMRDPGNEVALGSAQGIDRRGNHMIKV